MVISRIVPNSQVANETEETRINDLTDNFGNVAIDKNSGSRSQVIEKNCADHQHRSEDDNVVAAVKTWVHDAILAATDNVVITEIEMALKSTARLYGHGPNSVVQNPDRRDFSGNMEFTPFKTVSS